MPKTCPCGKAAFPSKAAADQLVVKAKIAHALRRNRRRREQRTYECTTRPGVWHLTSQPTSLRYQWPGWDDATDDIQCDRCPTVIAAGEPVALVGDSRLCIDCGDLVERSALGAAAS
ncbi:hypothetical protein [Pseudonocardia parietis]|uniref:DksA C4-type domain-containing protein n=1 Tax=Pseudonocardia parietis TaxID=570936 RepID=A0ABS4W244_9PSEU|nr:hypothetical protein [Pseudonocardia parietis]MBP2370277.1 hypothetical protein [Pseudonocardia parietis]